MLFLLFTDRPSVSSFPKSNTAKKSTAKPAGFMKMFPSAQLNGDHSDSENKSPPPDNRKQEEIENRLLGSSPVSEINGSLEGPTKTGESNSNGIPSDVPKKKSTARKSTGPRQHQKHKSESRESTPPAEEPSEISTNGEEDYQLVNSVAEKSNEILSDSEEFVVQSNSPSTASGVEADETLVESTLEAESESISETLLESEPIDHSQCNGVDSEISKESADSGYSNPFNITNRVKNNFKGIIKSAASKIGLDAKAASQSSRSSSPLVTGNPTTTKDKTDKGNLFENFSQGLSRQLQPKAAIIDSTVVAVIEDEKEEEAEEPMETEGKV